MGRTEFECPGRAAGFAVDLPGGVRVVDLGTAFEVEVSADGRSTVRVTEGVVRIEHATATRQLIPGQVAYASASGLDVIAATPIVWASHAIDAAADSDARPAGAARIAGANLGAGPGSVIVVDGVRFIGTGTDDGVTRLDHGVSVKLAGFRGFGPAIGLSNVAGELGRVLDSNIGVEPGAGTITIGGLTPGRRYELRAFMSARHAELAGFSVTIRDSRSAAAGPALHSSRESYVAGTFTAGPEPLSLTIAESTHNIPTLNALVIAELGDGAIDQPAQAESTDQAGPDPEN
jgi:hypothetical protein